MQSNFGSNPAAAFSQQGFLAGNNMMRVSDPLHQSHDPNSPESFKRNIRVAQESVLQLGNLARRVLTEIQNAYHEGNSPPQTEADIAALKQSIDMLYQLMRHTGIGALPVLPLRNGTEAPSMGVPTEQQLIDETSRSIQVLFEKLNRSQESASVVAKLLGAEQMPKNTR